MSISYLHYYIYDNHVRVHCLLIILWLIFFLSERDYWYEEARSALKKRLAGYEGKTGRAKNVVFLVGDGMGASTLTASRIFKGQRRGNQGEEEELLWDTFPAVAMSKVSRGRRARGTGCGPLPARADRQREISSRRMITAFISRCPTNTGPRSFFLAVSAVPVHRSIHDSGHPNCMRVEKRLANFPDIVVSVVAV